MSVLGISTWRCQEYAEYVGAQLHSLIFSWHLVVGCPSAGYKDGMSQRFPTPLFPPSSNHSPYPNQTQQSFFYLKLANHPGLTAMVLAHLRLLAHPFAIAGILVGVLASAAIYRAARGPLSHIPGPWYSRLTSLVLVYHWLRGERSAYVHRLHQKYGPVVRIAPDEADLTDLAAKHQIYTVKEVFLKSIFYSRIRDPRNENIFSTRSIPQHRQFRRLLSGPLSESSLKLVEPIVRSKVDLAMQRMNESMQTDGVMDVYKWALFMATDIIGELTFGESFRMLESGKINQYIVDLQSIAKIGGINTAFPGLIKFIRSKGIWTPIDVINQAATIIPRFTSYAVQSLERYQRLVKEDPDNVPQTLFTKVFKAKDDDTLDFNDIVGNARAYLVAGSDTTAHTLTYLIWAVCKHPEVRQRLVDELQKNLPAENDDITDHDLVSLPYLTSVIEEILRLYSAAPSGLPRVVPPEGAELGGYWFEPGTTVCMQAYSMHRDPAIFPNPNAFDPDRWSPSRVTKDMKDAFMPFGAGSRICIGLHLAQTELRLATALFFRTFPNATVSTREKMSDADMDPKIYFLLTPKGKRCLIEGY
ncbi:cytochrome P450 [Bombardia bombarda]|uniref:Cytochrome P450 n=1 Tax=Bombardia bombarda TaxID=252184 RepID=A0AA40CAH9_9PEZI|nr:cytochrome P450 [Bombardia bombarda]